MIRRISILSVVALASILAYGQVSKGDTIVVTDLTQNTLTGVYTYGVQFTHTANVMPGDGFVIYDFLGLTSTAQVSFAFTTSVPAGAAFNAFLSPLYNYINAPLGPSAPAGPANVLDTGLNTVLLMTDDPLINNLSMVYSGPTIMGTTSGILTVTSSVAGPGATLTNVGVASKDTSGGLYAYSDLTGPGFGGGGSVPLPASFLGGGMLMFGLAIAGLFKKMRSQFVAHA